MRMADLITQTSVPKPSVDSSIFCFSNVHHALKSCRLPTRISRHTGAMVVSDRNQFNKPIHCQKRRSRPCQGRIRSRRSGRSCNQSCRVTCPAFTVLIRRPDPMPVGARSFYTQLISVLSSLYERGKIDHLVANRLHPPD